MVVQDNLYDNKEMINDIEKEIRVLYELGVDDSEIKYLLYLKRKKENSLRWEN